VTHRAVALVLACVLVAGAACRGDAPPAEEDGWKADPVPEAKDFALTVVAEPAKVELGGDLVLKVRVENRGDVKAQLNVPRLGRDSVTFRVRSPAFEAAWLDPMPVKETATGYEPDPPALREIGKGEAVEGEVRVAAVLAGKLVLVPVYTCQALERTLTGTPVEVEVTPAAGGAHLGFRLDTSHGVLDAKLRPELAFQTCTSFATLVKKGFYDGLTFHRVVKGFMAQGGDPAGAGWGGPGYALRRELHGRLPHRRGVFSMARKSKPVDSAGSQFFLMFSERPDFDDTNPTGPGGYTSFAELVAGQDALARIESVGGSGRGGMADEKPKETITIRKASLIVLP
jgi:cyclophilin family peptidyl-prolyl cis-trans isomerase